MPLKAGKNTGGSLSGRPPKPATLYKPHSTPVGGLRTSGWSGTKGHVQQGPTEVHCREAHRRKAKASWCSLKGCCVEFGGQESCGQEISVANSCTLCCSFAREIHLRGWITIPGFPSNKIMEFDRLVLSPPPSPSIGVGIFLG